MTKTGLTSKVYYRSGGTYGSPTWTEVDNIEDFSRSLTREKLASNSRATPVNLSVPGPMELGFTGTMKNDGSAVWKFLYEAMLKGDAVDFLVLDGARDLNGSTGWRADCCLFDASEEQNRSTRLYTAIDVVPTDSDNLPKAVLVAGGVPTYAPITGSTLVYS